MENQAAASLALRDCTKRQTSIPLLSISREAVQQGLLCQVDAGFTIASKTCYIRAVISE